MGSKGLNIKEMFKFSHPMQIYFICINKIYICNFTCYLTYSFPSLFFSFIKIIIRSGNVLENSSLPLRLGAYVFL